jgi:hypothetical protein
MQRIILFITVLHNGLLLFQLSIPSKGKSHRSTAIGYRFQVPNANRSLVSRWLCLGAIAFQPGMCSLLAHVDAHHSPSGHFVPSPTIVYRADHQRYSQYAVILRVVSRSCCEAAIFPVRNASRGGSGQSSPSNCPTDFLYWSCCSNSHHHVCSSSQDVPFQSYIDGKREGVTGLSIPWPVAVDGRPCHAETGPSNRVAYF